MVDDGYSFASLISLVCESWPCLDRKQVKLSFSIPGYEKCVMNNQQSIDVIRYLGLAKVDVTVSLCHAGSTSSSNITYSGGSIVQGTDNDDDYAVEGSSGTVLLSSAWAGLIRHVDQVFDGGAPEFRLALTKFSIETGFEFDYKRNDPDIVIAWCKRRVVDGCKWFILGRKHPSNPSFVVRELCNEHTCEIMSGADRSKRLNARLITGLIKNTVAERHDLCAKDVASIMRTVYGLDVGYKKCWNALQSAKRSICGGSLDSFKELDAYLKAAELSNPHSHFVLDVEPSRRSFVRLFMSFSACIEGFKHCRPMLYLDGSFLKGTYQGQLLSATARNGDDGFFPLAYGVVDQENKENWTWFLEQLRIIIGADLPLVFFSDRHPGLLAAMPLVFPSAHHSYCLQHLADSLKKRFCGSGWLLTKKNHISYLFKRCAKAMNVQKFNERMEILLKDGGTLVKDFLADLPPETWATAFIDRCRYGDTTSNIAESFNAWVLIERELPITQMADAIRIKMMTMMNDRRLESGAWQSLLCPKFEAIWTKFALECRTWLIKPASESVFEVYSDPSHMVDFKSRTCTCLKWQVLGFPCIHAVYCVKRSKYTKAGTVEYYFHSEAFRKTYELPLNPVPSCNWSGPNVVLESSILPPTTKRSAGRPKKNRNISLHERFERVVRKITCGRCKKNGHNKKTCKEPIGPFIE